MVCRNNGTHRKFLLYMIAVQDSWGFLTAAYRSIAVQKIMAFGVSTTCAVRSALNKIESIE